jgi:hypothetical protein
MIVGSADASVKDRFRPLANPLRLSVLFRTHLFRDELWLNSVGLSCTGLQRTTHCYHTSATPCPQLRVHGGSSAYLDDYGDTIVMIEPLAELHAVEVRYVAAITDGKLVPPSVVDITMDRFNLPQCFHCFVYSCIRFVTAVLYGNRRIDCQFRRKVS